MSFVSIDIYKKVKRLALAEGLDPSLLPQIDAQLLPNLEKKYLPLDDLLKIYELANSNLEDGFAIRVGKEMIPEDYGTLGLSWKTAWTARDFLERTVRYIVLITDKGVFEMKDIGGNTNFIMKRPADTIGQKLSNEATFGMFVGILRQVTDTCISPISVSFEHKPPKDPSDYIEHFGCQVVFNAKQNSICFSMVDLNIQTTKADKSINGFLTERLEEERKGIEKKSNHLAVDVETIIRDSLPNGIPSVVMVGNLLGMSNRTLTRRLSESKLSFRDLIKKAQESISKDLLQNTQLSVGEIAFQTGFSEQSAFNRAFKRWTGLSPIEFRKI